MAIYLKGKEMVCIFFTKHKFGTIIRVFQENLKRKKTQSTYYKQWVTAK